jgi:oligogalacturonide lyase
MTFADGKDLSLHNSLMAARTGVPRVLFVVNTRTGELKEIFREREWLGTCSFGRRIPTSSCSAMKARGRPYLDVRTDVSALTKSHTRSMNMEIAGHEFFSSDGGTIWYDLQTPRGLDFWLAGYRIASGKRTWYHLLQNEWSVHFNVSPDGTRLAVMAATAKWWHALPTANGSTCSGRSPCQTWPGSRPRIPTPLIDVGFFKSERLVNMSKHDYRLEPNVTFSPDMKWVVFRSNMLGSVHLYAVEVAKAAQP